MKEKASGQAAARKRRPENTGIPRIPAVSEDSFDRQESRNVPGRKPPDPGISGRSGRAGGPPGWFRQQDKTVRQRAGPDEASGQGPGDSWLSISAERCRLNESSEALHMRASDQRMEARQRKPEARSADRWSKAKQSNRRMGGEGLRSGRCRKSAGVRQKTGLTIRETMV